VFSCSDGLDRLPKPDKLMAKDQMVVVMKEMIKLESFVQLRYKNVAEYHKVMIASGDSILKANNVSRELYDNSLDYYGSRQEEMQEIYNEVLDDLTRELGELQSSK
jgi:hypothetical protein